MKSLNPRHLFDEWNQRKQELHIRTDVDTLYINPRDIWYISLGVNVGNEENGKIGFRRPMLVLRRIGNMYFCVPLTTKGKEGRFYLPVASFVSPRPSWVLVSQARTIDKRRFLEKIGMLSPEEFRAIKKSLVREYF